MSGPGRIRVRIDRLRVTGGARSDAQALGAAIRRSLARELSGAAGRLTGAARVRLSDPGGPAAERGRAIGQGIGATLKGKGGRP